MYMADQYVFIYMYNGILVDVLFLDYGIEASCFTWCHVEHLHVLFISPRRYLVQTSKNHKCMYIIIPFIQSLNIT